MRTPGALLVSIVLLTGGSLAACGPGARQAAPAAGPSSGAESGRASAGGGASAGGQANQQGALVPATAPTSSGSAQPPRGTLAGAGADREHPVEVCGATESYLYVAGRFQCPGGGNPLGGDPGAGARARLGNVGPHAHGAERDPMLDAHIVDLYEVPCPTGAVQVHVCLYHCPPGRTPIDG